MCSLAKKQAEIKCRIIKNLKITDATETKTGSILYCQ